MAAKRSVGESAAAPAPERKRLPPLLRRAWYGLNQAFRQRIAHLQLTPDQFSILRWLSEGDLEGLTQRAITDLMASDPNTITSTLSRMQTAGLITRGPHELDRRAHRVRLQPEGRRTFEKAKRIAIALQDRILTALPVARRSKFLEELETIADACGAAAETEKLAKRKHQPHSNGRERSHEELLLGRRSPPNAPERVEGASVAARATKGQ